MILPDALLLTKKPHIYRVLLAPGGIYLPPGAF
jgi:hypothetical protein